MLGVLAAFWIRHQADEQIADPARFDDAEIHVRKRSFRLAIMLAVMFERHNQMSDMSRQIRLPFFTPGPAC